MIVLQRIFTVLLCACLLGGCYEDEAEVTINADGSGTVKEKLVISERLIVATSEDGGNENTPPVSKEKVLKEVGSAVEITSITQTDLPDGGRTIEFEGTFSSPEQFFLSEFCQEQLKLRIAPAGEGKAAIYCDMKKSGDGGPSLTQLYGMAKGLYIKRTVHLPTEVEKSNGYSDKAKNTVSWATDLRNKEGLAKTKLFIEGPDEGNGFAVFDASVLKFTLPLKAAALPEKTVEAEKEKARIGRDTKDLQRRKVKLSSEVDGKEASLRKLDEIGLSNEDLLRLTSFIERTSKNEGLSGNQVKERFFSALSLFEDVSGLENRRKVEMQQVSELVKKQSILSGQIFELEKRKGILEGEIGDSISSTSQRIRDIGEKAASQIQQQVDDIDMQFNRLFEDTLRVGEIVGEMQQMVKKGENTGQSLKDFLEETRSKLGAR